eukprot:618456-Rhodomonas_salina.1
MPQVRAPSSLPAVLLPLSQQCSFLSPTSASCSEWPGEKTQAIPSNYSECVFFFQNVGRPGACCAMPSQAQGAIAPDHHHHPGSALRGPRVLRPAWGSRPHSNGPQACAG